jgi:hypothetical protein
MWRHLTSINIFILLNIQVIILLDHIKFLAEAESFLLCQPNQFYSQMTLITNR